MKKKSPAKKKSVKASIKRKYSKLESVIDQAKEPVSLLSTLRQEGLSSALSMMSMASELAGQASKKIQVESVKPILMELIHSMGVVLKSDLEKLENRVDELEEKLAQFEMQKMEEE